MRKKLFILVLLITNYYSVFTALFATPSTVFWTPCTPYFQPYMKGHITYDTYVRTKSAMPVDYGFTTGVLPFKKIQMEIGYDAFLPVPTPEEQHYLNAKIGSPEGELLPVGFSLGMFSKGVRSGVTDYDIWHLDIGKTFKSGSFSAGYYSGNKSLLVDEKGKTDNTGFMLGYLSPQYKKFIFAFDYMSGKNSFSATGFGLYTYFADNVTLLTGPVFPLAKTFYGGDKMTWTLQLDIDFDIK
ncbi:MAG: hypothetical protein PHE88_06345 [Elusimicrobia bacterium]|nr:hypothetical protein [Elusimicrobiota bacterium]